MKNECIEVGKDYYGYDCADNGVFRLLRYHITSKQTWTCTATVYQVGEVGSGLQGNWQGYPDNLYKTKGAALNALKDNVQKLTAKVAPEKIEKPRTEIVDSSSPYICCATCMNLASGTFYGDYCSACDRYIDKPNKKVCKGNKEYKCFDIAIDELAHGDK